MGGSQRNNRANGRSWGRGREVWCTRKNDERKASDGTQSKSMRAKQAEGVEEAPERFGGGRRGGGGQKSPSTKWVSSSKLTEPHHVGGAKKSSKQRRLHIDGYYTKKDEGERIKS